MYNKSFGTDKSNKARLCEQIKEDIARRQEDISEKESLKLLQEEIYWSLKPGGVDGPN